MTTIVIVAYGSRGDVSPYTGLGVRLREAGFRVAVAAQGPYRDLIGDLGLEYRFMPTDTEAATKASPAAQRFIDGDRMLPSRAMLAEMTQYGPELGEAIVDVCAGADLLILAGTIATMFGYHVAQGMGIPSIGAHLQPSVPTGDFPPFTLGSRSYGRWGNRMLGRLAALGDKAYLPTINDVRRRVGLPPTTVGAYSRERAARWPILHGFSEHVVPRPADWRPGLEVTGYWWPATPPVWRPPADLVDFIESGSAPVYIGFGSTATNKGPQLSRIIGEAVRAAGVRAVVQSGWAELDCGGTDLLTIGDVPHEWLFPRMAAVVHHAGCGTTAAGLRAGVPAVAIPGIMDQPFWAKRLVDLGVAPGSIRRPKLRSDELAALITAAVSDSSYHDRAQQMSRKLAAEDGIGRAVAAVTGLLEASTA